MKGVARGRSWAVSVAAAWLVACGGGSDAPDDTPGPPPDPLPPAGTMRWASLAQDRGADGSVEFITVYSYDADGRRHAQRTYRAVDNAPDGEPVSERRWEFDAWSRIVAVIDIDASGTRTATMTYGSDGRLAQTKEVSLPDAVTTILRYTWRDGRMVEYGGDGTGGARYLLSYGSDGRVSGVELVDSGSDYYFYGQYGWRPDGQPGGMSFDSGFVASYSYGYDAQGRHVSSRLTDDGYPVTDARLAYETGGRLVTVDSGQAVDDGVAFVPGTRLTYRWEAGRCQPLVIPGPPPYIGSSIAGLVSADNVSFGCAP